MNLTLAQNLRRIGLAIEALCLLSLLAFPQKVELKPFMGIDQSRILMVGLALGFAVWLVGTASIYWPRKDDPSDS